MANMRNTVAYFKIETTEGVAVTPTSATDGFVSIETPDVTTGEKELLDSELLTGSIGYKKPQLGFETAGSSNVTELRSHGDATTPTAPDFGAWFETMIGDPNISTATTVGALPAPSTTEFTIPTEGAIKKHDFMIIANTTDKRVARFCKSLKLAVVAGVNDKIDVVENGGDIVATLTAGSYVHGSSSVAGSIGEHIKTQLDLAGAGTYTVSAALQGNGSYIYTITATGLTTLVLENAGGANTATNFLKLNLGFGAVDLSGALTYTAGSACWGNRVVCQRAMTTAPTSGDVISATVNYKPMNTGHKSMTAGYYNGNASDGYLEQVIGARPASIEFSIETGAIAKISMELQGMKGARTASTPASFTPSFEDVQGLVAFCVEAAFDSTLIDANTTTITIENEITPKNSFKECSGRLGQTVRSRKVSGSINPFNSGSIDNYTALNALTDKEFSLVIGSKDTNGFIVGKTVGIYLPQIMFSADKTANIDDSIIEDISFQAHRGSAGTLSEICVSFG